MTSSPTIAEDQMVWAATVGGDRLLGGGGELDSLYLVPGDRGGDRRRGLRGPWQTRWCPQHWQYAQFTGPLRVMRYSVRWQWPANATWAWLGRRSRGQRLCRLLANRWHGGVVAFSVRYRLWLQ